MTEATGLEAKTIHRLLEVDPKASAVPKNSGRHPKKTSSTLSAQSGRPAGCEVAQELGAVARFHAGQVNCLGKQLAQREPLFGRSSHRRRAQNRARGRSPAPTLQINSNQGRLLRLVPARRNDLTIQNGVTARPIAPRYIRRHAVVLQPAPSLLVMERHVGPAQGAGEIFGRDWSKLEA